jgi:hypothetical protein
MLIVRAEQLRVLREAREAAFFRDLEAHVRRHFPAVAESQSEESLRRSIRAAAARAASFGLEKPADLCRYVNIAAVLGWGFHAAPEHAWIVALLGDASIPSASHRLRLAGEELARRMSLEEQKRVAEQRFQAAVSRRSEGT